MGSGGTFEPDWQTVGEEIFSGMREWRLQHPQATLREIETALDERLARLRARMLQDTALATRAADWATAPTADHPVCFHCQTPLEARGQQTRTLQTQGGRDVVLERTYGVSPTGQAGFVPPG